MMSRMAAVEAMMWRSLFQWLRRAPLDLAPGEQAFTHHRIVNPILGAFIGMSIVEIPILDVIVSHVIPWPPARWITLALSLWGLLWMLGLLAAMRRTPHVVGPAGIRARTALGVDITVPWEQITTVTRSVRPLPSSKSIQVEDGALHLVAGSETNVDIHLRSPVALPLPAGAGPPVTQLRLHADDEKAFVAAAHMRLTSMAL